MNFRGYDADSLSIVRWKIDITSGQPDNRTVGQLDNVSGLYERQWRQKKKGFLVAVVFLGEAGMNGRASQRKGANGELRKSVQDIILPAAASSNSGGLCYYMTSPG